MTLSGKQMESKAIFQNRKPVSSKTGSSADKVSFHKKNLRKQSGPETRHAEATRVKVANPTLLSVSPPQRPQETSLPTSCARQTRAWPRALWWQRHPRAPCRARRHSTPRRSPARGRSGWWKTGGSFCQSQDTSAFLYSVIFLRFWRY